MKKKQIEEIELPLLDKSGKAPQPQKKFYDSSTLASFVDLTQFQNKFRTITSYLSYYTFYDSFSTLKKINSMKKKIGIDEIPLPHVSSNVPKAAVQLDQNWQEELKTENPSLPRAIYKTFKYKIWRAGIITFLVCNCYIFDTFILGSITSLVTEISLGNKGDANAAFMLGAIFAFSFIAKILLESLQFSSHQECGASIRLSVASLLYKKLNCVSMTSLQKMNIGKVINLLGNDLNELDSSTTHSWAMVMSPYNIIICTYMMSRYYGWYAILALVMIVGSMHASTKIAKFSKTTRSQKNQVSDSRIKHTNELIDGIRLIKLYAWEKPIAKIISGLRSKELGLLQRVGANDAFNKTIQESSIYIVVLVLSIVYIANGGILSPDKVFATTAILNFVRRRVLMNWSGARTWLVSVKLLRQRVEDLLAIKDVTSLYQIPSGETEDVSPTVNGSLVFANFSASWSEDISQPCLKNLTSEIPRNKLTVVIGAVGSGKTTFLLSFLREIPTTSGILNCNGSMAYVEQEPIVFSQSVRDNILFGQPFDEELYKKVLLACNLDEDLTQFDHGDQTLVGERGVTLSGGQKARVSMARALYSRSDIYLLDDPLSAVDSRVAYHIFDKAVKGILKDKTVVLVTHHLNFAKQADKVIVFNNGEIQGQGNFQEIQRMNINLINMFVKDNKASKSEDNRKKSSVQQKVIDLGKKKQEMRREENRPVTWDTCRKYLRSCDKPGYGILAVCCVIVAYFCVVVITRVLGMWADDQTAVYHDSQTSNTVYEFDHTYYIVGTIFLILLIVTGIYVKGIAMMKFCLNINTNIHLKLLTAISRAVVSFFDKTPVGTILNRFSTNMGAVDRDLWSNVYMVINGFFQNALFLIYISSNNFLLLIPAIIIFTGFFKVRNFFAKPLREMKQLDLITRSPMYSEISSTINGLVIIRTYRQGTKFVQRFMNHVYNCSRVIMFHQRTERLFTVSLFGLLYLLAMTGTFLFLFQAVESGIEPGLFGMALYYLIVIGSNSILTTKQTLSVTISMQHAENIFQYCEIQQEPTESPYDKDNALVKETNDSWPPRGEITFNNVFLKYKDTNTYALNGINFVIPEGCKVGIVGRTGAGKSSIIQALFRMVELEENPTSSIKIDGTNTKDISLDFLRKNLCIIPQTPVIFSGNIRRNLDPFEEYADAKLWEALEQVKLKTYVESLDQKLDTEIGVTSSVFSAGQKQLICLARVILKKKKIMVLDEATANVDYETDSFVQDQIMKLFADCTILTIAHRLMTIAHYDRVMVLDRGIVVEYDHPYKLLVETIGDKRISNQTGMFARMVIKNGSKVAQQILKVAYLNYFKNEQTI